MVYLVIKHNVVDSMQVKILARKRVSTWLFQSIAKRLLFFNLRDSMCRMGHNQTIILTLLTVLIILYNNWNLESWRFFSLQRSLNG